MEEVKTEKRSNFIPLLYLIIAYRAFPRLAAIQGFQEMRQQFFYMFTPLLDRQAHVHDSIMHNPTPKRYVLVPKHSRDDICLSIMTGELELSLNKIEYVLTAFDCTRDPAFPDLYLVLAPSEVYFSSRLVNGDLVSPPDDFKVYL